MKAVISSCQSISPEHLCGDAAFSDGRKYRFVIQGSRVSKLFAYDVHNYSSNRNLARRAPKICASILLDALPLRDGVYKQCQQRRTAEDAEVKRKAEVMERARLAKIELLRQYTSLHDGLSNMIEGGRLKEADIPDDYKWLCDLLERCVVLNHQIEDAAGE